MDRRRFLALATLLLSGCYEVLGLGDYKEGPAGAGGAGGAATTSASTTAATMTASTTASQSASGSTSSSGSGLPMCGDGMTEAPEVCDGDCPVECIDPDLCTSEVPTGDPAMCDVTCGFKALVACKSGDGCCPTGCANSNDKDCAQRILVLSGGPASFATPVKTALVNTGSFGIVDSLNFPSGTPVALTLAQLTPYSAVLVYTFNSFSDAKLVGDVLADYVDQGGRVVLSMGANCADQYRIRGRFEADGYFLNDDGGVVGSVTALDATFGEPASPLVVGVTATSVTGHCELTPTAGATVVASFVDGAPFILRGKRFGRNRVDLNFLITSDYDDPSLIRATVNALKYPL